MTMINKDNERNGHLDTDVLDWDAKFGWLPKEESGELINGVREKFIRDISERVGVKIVLFPALADIQNLPNIIVFPEFLDDPRIVEDCRRRGITDGDIILLNGSGETLSELLQKYFPETLLDEDYFDDGLKELLSLDLNFSEATIEAFAKLNFLSRILLLYLAYQRSTTFYPMDVVAISGISELNANLLMKSLQTYGFLKQSGPGYQFVSDKVRRVVKKINPNDFPLHL